MVDLDEDRAIRTAVFAWLSQQEAAGKTLFSRRELLDEFRWRGERLPLIDVTRGIRNPRQLAATLSVTSGIDGGSVEQYEDDVDLASGIVRYAYQRGEASSNTKLSRASELNVPIVYFVIVEPGLLAASYPVYVHDVPSERAVELRVDQVKLFQVDEVPGSILERSYIERTMWQRVHQSVFRGMVMRAYEERCAVCRLAHRSLLDAAHILGDRHELGVPHTSNGLALCKLHHGAYDRNILGITADLTVVIPRRILAERDGPMLRHGLQEMHGSAITVPTARGSQPNREHLRERFVAFESATS